MDKESPRIKREGDTMAVMISLYCHHRHEGKKLCDDCNSLLEYALERLKKCPFDEGKTTCAKCPVHCFKTDMRQQIRLVMRYSGPRMIYRHPIMALRHLLDGRRKKPVKSPA